MQRAFSSGADVLHAPTRSEPRRTADILVEILIEAGVDVVFGLPGGAISPIHDALLDRREVRSITMRHECDAVFAAAGYARASGKIGVVAVTSGPGVLNALTGLASARCDGLPVLVLAGEVPRHRFGRGAFQEGSVYGLDIVSLGRTLAKMSAEMTDPNAAPALLRRAIATAMSGRKGPVLLTLPMDVTTAKVKAPLVSVIPRVDFDIAPDALQATADTLTRARTGIMLVGSGARWGNGPQLVRQLAERLDMPVMTTPKGKGVFPESHRLSLGVFGWGGHPSATEYLRTGVDVVVALGTSLGEIATDNWSPLLKPRESFVQIDADASNIGRSYAVDLGLVATLDVAIPELLGRLRKAPKKLRRYGVRRLDPGRTTPTTASGKIAPQRALWELQQRMPAGTLYTSDIGAHMLAAIHHLEIDQPDGFTLMSGLASMASGLGAAVGAKVARPTSPVVAICGDGGFAMGLGAISSAVAEGIPMIVVCLNDERYGMVELGNTLAYGRTPTYSMTSSSVTELARAVGAHAVPVTSPGEILKLDLVGMATERPVVLDVRTEFAIQVSDRRIGFIAKSGSTRALH